MKSSKTLKSWQTLAGESKAQRKTTPTQEQVEKLNKVFEEIERNQDKYSEDLNRKIARQPEV